MLSLKDSRTLAQVCNHTWGGSSTNRSPTMAVKGRMLAEDVFQVEYQTIFRVVSDRALLQEKQKTEKVAEAVMSEYIAAVRKEFKKQAGKTISFKQIDQNDSIEIIAVQRHVSLDKTVKYILKAQFEVSA